MSETRDITKLAKSPLLGLLYALAYVESRQSAEIATLLRPQALVLSAASWRISYAERQNEGSSGISDGRRGPGAVAAEGKRSKRVSLQISANDAKAKKQLI